MILRRYVSTASIVCSLALGFTGSALATDVSVVDGTTGPGSNLDVSVNNSSDIKVDNTNVVQVTNVSVQQSASGDVSANKNTIAGGPVQSGDASNASATTTVVDVANDAFSGSPVGGIGQADGTDVLGQNTNGVVGGLASSVPVAGAGHVLGAATSGGLGAAAPATLPAVGASVPVDVSALRSAWHPRGDAPTAVFAKGSRVFTTVMLITATCLSLLGAIGSAWYGRRKEERA